MKAITIMGAVLLGLLLNCPEVSAKRKVTEIYYSVNENGEIDNQKVSYSRTLTYDRKGNLIQKKSNTDKETRVSSDASEYYTLPLYLKKEGEAGYDKKKRLIRFKENSNGADITEHTFRYNDWGDLEEHIIRVNGSPATVFTYDYFYLKEFTYAWKGGTKFISGQKERYSNPWVLRTVKKNDKVVEHAERKID